MLEARENGVDGVPDPSDGFHLVVRVAWPEGLAPIDAVRPAHECSQVGMRSKEPQATPRGVRQRPRRIGFVGAVRALDRHVLEEVPSSEGAKVVRCESDVAIISLAQDALAQDAVDELVRKEDHLVHYIALLPPLHVVVAAAGDCRRRLDC